MMHGAFHRFTDCVDLAGLRPEVRRAIDLLREDRLDATSATSAAEACLEPLDDDPTHQRHLRLALDLLAWSHQRGEVQRDAMVAALRHCDRVRGRSINESIRLFLGHAHRVALPHWEQVRELTRFERMLVQGQLAHEASQDAGYWNTVYLGRALSDDAKLSDLRVLNAGDPVAPDMRPEQTTLGHSLCRRSQELGGRLRQVDTFDVLLHEDEAEDARRRSRLESVYGEEAVPERLTFRRADARRVPWDDETFDVVVSGGMLDHVLGADQALSELVRVCRVGGRIFVSGHHLAAGLERLERQVYAIGEYNHFDWASGRSTAVQPSEVLGWAGSLGLVLQSEMRRPHSWVLGFVRERS